MNGALFGDNGFGFHTFVASISLKFSQSMSGTELSSILILGNALTTGIAKEDGFPMFFASIYNLILVGKAFSAMISNMFTRPVSRAGFSGNPSRVFPVIHSSVFTTCAAIQTVPICLV